MIYLREKSITKSSIHIYQSILLSDLVPDAVHEGDLESLTTTKEQKAAQQHDLKMKTESREEMLIDPPSAITPKEEGKEEPQHDSLLHSPLPALVPPTQATIFRSTVPKVRGTPQVPTTPPWSERTLPILKDLPDINQLPASPHPILVMQPQHVLGAICYFGFENLRMQYPFIFSLPDYVTAFTSAMKKLKMNVKEELLSWTVGTALIVHPSFMKRKIPALLACAIGIGCTWGANYDRARANRKELRLRERAIVAEEQKNEMLADTSIVVSDDTFVPGPQTGAKSLNSPPYQSNIPNPLILFQHLSATERKHNDVAIASNVSDVTTRKIYKDAEEIMDELTWELNVYAREEEKATIIREEEEFQAALEVAKQQLRNGNIGNFNKLINQRKKK
ncbi:hypothetical protein BLNAU_16147 [Blattamonas nauphoetae]|uniref:Uncharacterized protein n=1 Tax=Blattamonas nauphoetae TaxID=2049346 RepID=A0ABQ9XC14_9EUKA|nr:hypothetical protein BLNAU_16147 [Blattamonas nauphoetae]